MPTEMQSKYPTTYYRVSLKAVIRNKKGEVLVNKEYDASDWSLPGGGWDHGETEHEALARELKEEVGYEGGFTSRPFATGMFWLDRKLAWLVWIVYEVETEKQDFSVGDDSTEIAFVDPKTLKGSSSRTEQWIFENLA